MPPSRTPGVLLLAGLLAGTLAAPACAQTRRGEPGAPLVEGPVNEQENPRQPGADPAAEPPPPARIRLDPIEPEPRARGAWEEWVEFKRNLQERFGTVIGINLDGAWRAAVAGPESDIGRAVGRYELFIRQYLGDDALLSLQVRGGWGNGLDEPLGTFINTNERREVNSHLFVLHLYYAHEFFDDQLTVRLGKLDIGDWIDTNRLGFYNFVAYGAAHNTTIPLVGNTLGVMASYQPAPAPWIYATAGISNASQTPYEAGFSSAFEDDAEQLVIGEIGLRPELFGREGVYRFIGWHSGADFTDGAGERESGASGFAISFDQDFTDRIGAFLRFGTADGDPFEPKRYYQIGFLIDEPFLGRPQDSIGFTAVVNEFTDDRTESLDDAAGAETYFELYYNVHLTDWAQLQPVVQVADNPGGRDRATAVIIGAHLALRF